MADRGAYRSKKAGEIDAIEARRLAGGFTFEELCSKADISTAQYRRMRRSGLGFTRRIKALQMALRTLEGEKKRESEVFPFDPPGRAGQASSGGSRASGAVSASALAGARSRT